MAYDRYDTRDNPRDERARWRGERFEGRDRDRDRRDDDRGFFERAGDEVASWFGDEDAERRRHQDRMRDEHEGGGLGRHNEDRGRFFGSDRGRDWHRDRGDEFHSMRSGMHERDRNPEWRRETWGSRDREFDRERGYRPMTGDYGRGELSDYGRPESQYGRDEYRRTSFAGSSMGERDQDPHYRSWRDRHLSELDRDYDEYRREHQSRFEDEFGSWRERRQQKRGLLGQIREHMEVVGNDDEHIGKVDRVAGDRIILAKSDTDSGGAHHSLSCSDIDRVDGDRVILDCSADQARQRWRDESRSRALFEREDQGEMGPRMLDRSFEGTYRR